MPELSRRAVLGCSALSVVAAALAGCGTGSALRAPVSGGGPDRIDVHQHMIPDAYRRWLAGRGVRDVGGIAVPAWSVAAAIASMDQVKTAKALLSVSAPGVTPAASAAEAVDTARSVNDAGAEVAKDRPDRFGFLATLPLPDVDAAIAEATRALDELGAAGVILLAHTGDTYLGDVGQADLFAALHRRKALVLVHPAPLPGPAVPHVPPLAADFLLDTVRAAYLLVRNGFVTLYPEIRFVLAHAGGFLPYAADRIAMVIAADTGLQPSVVREELRSFFFDTALSTGTATLPSLLAFAKPGHVVFGSDFPFAPQEAVEQFTAALDHNPDLDDPLRQAINRDNAVALVKP